jgi:hypothetical protein
MGCDYYIYSVLKIVHTNGVSLIKLSQEPVYLHGYNVDTDNFTIHPSKRRPKIDHMKPECEDVLIYKKDEQITCEYLSQYMELIEELIKDYHEENYISKNKIILNSDMFSHDTNGESLKSIDDINELYIVELRAWRN